MQKDHVKIIQKPTTQHHKKNHRNGGFLHFISSKTITNNLALRFQQFVLRLWRRLYTVRDIVEAKGGMILGEWPTEGYEFEASKALTDENHFVGLCIDEDRQPELTDQRVSTWVNQIYTEMCLSELED